MTPVDPTPVEATAPAPADDTVSRSTGTTS
jgi:hypothetical protein